ncbi:MAG: hypothetical protein EZS28_012824 [Streblomastix strix]|uniref:Uncharacterized protein n=1 Tax=Streblomastix strix TaxID=222440 RepID=A0A5J4WAV1_9EUKA|nr:MAG: hypothetical protein EZS28_012824 [Streblomastix strix]
MEEKGHLEKLRTIFEQILLDLQIPFEVTRKEEIIQKQESSCKQLTQEFLNKDDNEGRKLAIQIGIADSLLKIFATRELETLSQAYAIAFFWLTFPCSFEIRQLIFQLNPYPALLRLLDSTNEANIDVTNLTIFNIQESGSETTQVTEAHHHYEVFIQCKGIEKLLELLDRNVDESIKNLSAINIAYLYRAREIADEEIRKKIIDRLKTVTNDSQNILNKYAILGLKYLAQNSENCAAIGSDGFAIPDVAENS